MIILLYFDEKWRCSCLDVLNVLERSVHKWASDSSVCIWEDVSVTIDAFPGASSKESDSIKDKIVSISSPNRPSDWVWQAIWPSVLSTPPDVFQNITENNKKRPENPGYLFSYYCVLTYHTNTIWTPISLKKSYRAIQNTI